MPDKIVQLNNLAASLRSEARACGGLNTEQLYRHVSVSPFAVHYELYGCPAIVAVLLNDMGYLHKLIERDCGLAGVYQGMTALDVAISLGNNSAIELLWSRCRQPYMLEEYAAMIFNYSREKLRVLRANYRYMPNINQVFDRPEDYDGWDRYSNVATALTRSVELNDYETVQCLLSHPNIDINTELPFKTLATMRDRSKATALSYSVKCASPQITALLLASGRPISDKTLLHALEYAVECNKAEHLRLLLLEFREREISSVDKKSMVQRWFNRVLTEAGIGSAVVLLRTMDGIDVNQPISSKARLWCGYPETTHLPLVWTLEAREPWTRQPIASHQPDNVCALLEALVTYGADVYGKEPGSRKSLLDYAVTIKQQSVIDKVFRLYGELSDKALLNMLDGAISNDNIKLLQALIATQRRIRDVLITPQGVALLKRWVKARNASVLRIVLDTLPTLERQPIVQQLYFHSMRHIGLAQGEIEDYKECCQQGRRSYLEVRAPSYVVPSWFKLVKVLEDFGADANAVNAKGDNALMVAIKAMSGFNAEAVSEVIKHFVARAVNFHVINKQGQSAFELALHYLGEKGLAMCWEDFQLSRVLSNGCTPLSHAVDRGYQQAAKQILRYGRSDYWLAKNTDASTALEVAVLKADLPLVRALMRRGALNAETMSAADRQRVFEAALLSESDQQAGLLLALLDPQWMRGQPDPLSSMTHDWVIRNKLIHHKQALVEVIRALSPVKQRSVLERCLNKAHGGSVLYRIFHSAKPFHRSPSIQRGCLKQLHDLLQQASPVGQAHRLMPAIITAGVGAQPGARVGAVSGARVWGKPH